MPRFDRKVFSLVLRPTHKYMLGRGVDAKDLLHGTGITDHDLASPYQLLGEQQVKQYYRNLVRLADSTSVGLEIGLLINLNEFGAVGLMSLAASTVAESLEIGRRNYDLTYMHLNWLTRVGKGSVIHNFVCNEPPGPLRVFLLERAMATLQHHAEIQIGEECRPTRVWLDYPDPGYRDEYEKIFGDVVEFDQASAEIRYPKKFLDTSIKTRDPEVQKSLVALCEDLKDRIASESSFVGDLRFVINEEPGVFLKISEAARKIGMSPRNLSRKIAQEGTTYQDIVDDLRREVAINQLRNSDLSIQEIADNCGFGRPQNFANAFRRWTGQTPSEYRNSVRQKG